MTINDILSRLKNVTKTGDGWKASCPCSERHSNGDANPSLGIDVGDDGKILICCRSQRCDSKSIVAALGLNESDLWPDDNHAPAKRNGRASTKAKKPPHVYRDCDGAVAASIRYAGEGAEHGGEWQYRGTDGNEVFTVLRINLPDGKKRYTPISRVDGGYIRGEPKGLCPLFNAPEILERPDEPVFAFEGEKCSQIGWSLGLLTTCSAFGVSGAKKSSWSILADRDVFVFPDAGADGRKYAEDVARLVGHAVGVVDLPDLSEGEDIEDFVRNLSGDDNSNVCELCDDPEIRAEIQRHIDNAETLEPKAAEPEGPYLAVRSFRDIRMERLSWLWPDRIPMGCLTILAGIPGQGKSLLSLDIASRVSSGTPWPDTPTTPNKAGGVLIMSLEDPVAKVVKPRLLAAGGNIDRLDFIDGTVRQPGGEPDQFSIARDTRILRKYVQQRPDTKLIVIDPLSLFLADGVDTHKEGEVRATLGPLAKLAEDLDIAIVVVAHLNKNAMGQDPMHRISGSAGIVAAVRAAWLIGADREDKKRRLCLSVKANLSEQRDGLAFRIVPVEVADEDDEDEASDEDDGGEASEPNMQPTLEWEPEPVEMMASDLLTAQQPERRAGKQQEAEDWLRDRLSDGEVLSSTLESEAEAREINLRMLKRAKQKIGTVARKARGGAWYCSLPENSQEGQDDPLKNSVPLVPLVTLDDTQGGQQGQQGQEYRTGEDVPLDPPTPPKTKPNNKPKPRSNGKPTATETWAGEAVCEVGGDGAYIPQAERQAS